MEEASSLAKAIENAWNRAGKPQSFSIKIFQDAEKNFFGITTKKAKIALFFAEGYEQHTQQQPDKQYPKKGVRSTAVAAAPQAKTSQPKKVEPRKKEQKHHEPTPPTLWSDAMVDTVKDWVTSYLQLQGLPNITFTVTPSGQHLSLHFTTSVIDRTKEHSLFSSLAHLLLTSLKQKFKNELRGLRITISQVHNV